MEKHSFDEKEESTCFHPLHALLHPEAQRRSEGSGAVDVHNGLLSLLGVLEHLPICLTPEAEQCTETRHIAGHWCVEEC